MVPLVFSSYHAQLKIRPEIITRNNGKSQKLNLYDCCVKMKVNLFTSKIAGTGMINSRYIVFVG